MQTAAILDIGLHFRTRCYTYSATRISRILLRTAWAACLISCICLRTRVPAALLPADGLVNVRLDFRYQRLKFFVLLHLKTSGLRIVLSVIIENLTTCLDLSKKKGNSFFMIFVPYRNSFFVSSATLWPLRLHWLRLPFIRFADRYRPVMIALRDRPE